MKRFPMYLTCVLVAMISLALLIPGQGQAADFKKEYKMQLNVPASFYWGMGAQKFVDLVKERTNGRIIIKPFWGSQLLKGAQLKSAQLVANGRTRQASFFAVCNLPLYGGRFRLAPAARLDDHHLHLVLFHGRGRAATLAFARDLLLGRTSQC